MSFINVKEFANVCISYNVIMSFKLTGSVLWMGRKGMNCLLKLFPSTYWNAPMMLFISHCTDVVFVFGLWKTYCTLYPWMKAFWYQYFAILAKGQRGAKSLLANVQHRGFVGWCTEPFKDANIGPKLHKSFFSFISEKSFTKSILKTTINTPTTKDLLAPTWTHFNVNATTIALNPYNIFHATQARQIM